MYKRKNPLAMSFILTAKGLVFTIIMYQKSFELGVSFVVLNYFCLIFIQIHAHFYINYIIYYGLLIFCCQNVATALL